MTRQWARITLSDVIPENLVVGVRNLRRQIVEPTAEAIELLAAILDQLSGVLYLLTDPQAAIINAAIDAIRAVLDQWRARYGVHVLIAPITAGGAKELLVAMSGRGEVASSAFGTEQWYSTFAQSLTDPGDDHRPEYGPEYFVASALIVLGTSRLGALIRAAYALRRLLGKLIPFDITEGALPVPQNLRLRSTTALRIETPNTLTFGDVSGDAVSGVLVWDAPSAIESLVRIGRGHRTVITHTVLYARSDRPFNVSDGGAALAELEVWRTSAPTVDTVQTVLLEAGSTWHFAVGFIAELEDPEDPGFVDVFEHYACSNSARVRAKLRGRRQHLPGGTPPDWVSASSVLDLLPGVGDAFDLLVGLLEDLRADLVDGAYEDIQAAIRLMREYAAFYLLRVRRIDEFLTLLQEVLEALDDVSAYTYVFAGPGGTQLLLSETKAALLDAGVKNQPPFRGSDDFAFVINAVAAGKEPLALRPVTDILALLLGQQPVSAVVEDALPSAGAPSAVISGAISTEVGVNVDWLRTWAEAEEAQAAEAESRLLGGEGAGAATPLDAWPS